VDALQARAGDAGSESTPPSEAASTGEAKKKKVQPRAANGQYASEWIHTPGNPYGRHVARMRTAVAETLTEEEAVAIAKKRIERAKAGNEAAAKLIFLYALGKPLDAMNPDWIDHDEWRLRMARPDGAEVMAGATQRPPFDVTMPFARATDYKAV